MTTVTMTSPNALSWEGNTYMKVKVHQVVNERTMSFRFNVCLLRLLDEEQSYVVYDERSGDPKRQRGVERPLLTAILDELLGQIIPKGVIKSIKVGPLRILITFHDSGNDYSDLKEIGDLVKQQIGELEATKVKGIQRKAE